MDKSEFEGPESGVDSLTPEDLAAAKARMEVFAQMEALKAAGATEEFIQRFSDESAKIARRKEAERLSENPFPQIEMDLKTVKLPNPRQMLLIFGMYTRLGEKMALLKERIGNEFAAKRRRRGEVSWEDIAEELAARRDPLYPNPFKMPVSSLVSQIGSTRDDPRILLTTNTSGAVARALGIIPKDKDFSFFDNPRFRTIEPGFKTRYEGVTATVITRGMGKGAINLKMTPKAIAKATK